MQHVLVQANVKGAQRPYEQFSYLPFKTWGGYSFDLTPPYYSFYYTVTTTPPEMCQPCLLGTVVGN